MAGSIPAKATKHLKSLLVTRYLIANQNEKHTRYLIANRNGKQEAKVWKPTPTAFPKTAINCTQGQMGKHQELAQDTNKWLITFTLNTTLLLRFSSYYIIFIKRFHLPKTTKGREHDNVHNAMGYTTRWSPSETNWHASTAWSLQRPSTSSKMSSAGYSRLLEEFAFRTCPYSNASVDRATGQGRQIRLASKIPFYLL